MKKYNLDEHRSFISDVLYDVVWDHEVHLRWLKTLSHMETCGATQIAKNLKIYGTNIPLKVLEHVNDEFRHAYYLRKQILKIQKKPMRLELLVRNKSKNMLGRIDLMSMRISREHYSDKSAKTYYLSYLLTTFAIELVAEVVYEEYQKVLDKVSSPVKVTSILAEEKEHLDYIMTELDKTGISEDKVESIVRYAEESMINLLELVPIETEVSLNSNYD